MSNMFSTGTSALLGYQRSLATVGNNVANATTPGYSRQVTELATLSTDGVMVQDVKRMSDSLATKRVLNSTGELNRLEQLSNRSTDVDSQFSESSTNLSGMWSSFFDSLSGLSSDPAAPTHRATALESANALTTRFQLLDSGLDTLDADCNTTLETSAAQVNDLTAQIAKLNSQISRGGNSALEAIDKRDLLIEQVIGYTGGTTTSQDDGAINIYTSGGQPLVIGATAMELTAVSDPYQPGRVNLVLSSQDQTIVLGDDVLGGSIGGVLEFRKDVLDPAINELGRLAIALADGVNDAQAAGTDIYGDAGTDMFALDGPTTSAHSNNSGTATVAAEIVDIGALSGNDLVLRLDSGTWTARRADNGDALTLTGSGTETDPWLVEGLSLVLSGTASSGDRFLVRPTASAAGTIDVTFTDPGLIAAARAVQGTANLDNIGNATVDDLSVTDSTDAALRSTATIEFTDEDQYTITVDGTETGPYSYTSGAAIAANGWSFILKGAPAAGDIFTISATGAGSSDNGNMLLMAALDESLVLDDGTISLNAALAGMTSTVAAATAQANIAHESEQVINNQAVAARDAISGVNLDEEAANLIKYQQAYQAAAKIIASADDIFQTLLQAV